ncbi:MAG: hypothetical protein KC609_17560, partial [Myxococcales bacterium]|nr:hypothetical protein [Myxococcales bacterium]
MGRRGARRALRETMRLALAVATLACLFVGCQEPKTTTRTGVERPSDSDGPGSPKKGESKTTQNTKRPGDPREVLDKAPSQTGSTTKSRDDGKKPRKPNRRPPVLKITTSPVPSPSPEPRPDSTVRGSLGRRTAKKMKGIARKRDRISSRYRVGTLVEKEKTGKSKK